MNITILVADDDELMRDLVCDIIRKEGYSVVAASDGQQALDIFFGSNNIDLIILDVMMPAINGWDVLKEIREHSEVPIIMLTALGDIEHEVLGFKKGADDYISKPFSYEVIVARINALLRKLKKERLSTINCGPLEINQETMRVTIDNCDAGLNRKEFSLLIYFLRNKNRVLTRDQILNSVWGYDFDGDIRTIDTHVKTLRAKLLEGGKYIKTVRGTGYMFEVNEDENN